METTVAIMMTVHNCKNKTLSFLEDCYRQIDTMKGKYDYSFSFYVLDDGSIDGTSEEILNNFPEINLIKGNGQLYWSRGMSLVWKEAALKDYDFYFWLNVDTILKEDAIASMMENSRFLGHRAIIAGTAVNEEGSITSGGLTKAGKHVIPEKVIPVPCYTINGNLVLIPRYVYKILGNIDPHYRHYFGDLDYGVRAYKVGIVRVVAPGILATYSPKEETPKLFNSEQFLYDLRSAGFFHAISHILSLNMKVLFAYSKKI